MRLTGGECMMGSAELDSFVAGGPGIPLDQTVLVLSNVEPIEVVTVLVGYAALAGATGAISAFVYRWYVADELPEGIAILFGVSTVALWLNTQGALGAAIIGESPLLDPVTAIFTVVAFVLAGIAADIGRRFGDHLGREYGTITGTRDIQDVGRIVRSAGRVTSVTLPASIEDIDGYDPVAPDVKAELSGATMLFPGGVTREALRERLSARLRRDYRLEHVDVDVSEDGAVEYLAVGARVAGLGPTLPPGTVAVAIRADPAFSASPGDRVEVWRRGDGGPERVCRAELRASVEDVVTLAVDESDAGSLAPIEQYRLLTLPEASGADREFAALLRGADETVTAIDIADGDDLEGTTVASLEATVLAVTGPDGTTIRPEPDRRLRSGERVLLLAHPEALRRLPR